MKKDNVCPKCGSHHILEVPSYEAGFAAGNSIATGMSIFSRIPTQVYVCADCGFVEEYVEQDGLNKLKKKYDK